MLALKECLIREGVLNLNNPSPNISSTSTQPYTPPYPLYRNHYSFGSHLDMLASSALDPKTAIDKSANDLTNSVSSTAKSSCQLQQQNPQQLQYPPTEQQQQSLLKKQQNFKNYQGHHPHFHHHTAPAYYTDLHLRIHTPEVKDSLNENYRSVYRTPSKLLEDERQFPKSTTATVAPPPILTKSLPKDFATEQQEGNSTTSSSSFFRGAACGLPKEEQRKIPKEPAYGNSSPSLAHPAKGNSPLLGDEPLPLVASSDGSVVFACTNFKPTNSVHPSTISPKQSPSTGRRSRNPQRFNNRRRAVRVRSESRPISALYDIICKEKGLEICTTTTNDEDSSPHQSHDEKLTKTRRSHSRSVTKQATKASSYSGSGGGMMSPGGDPNRGLAVGQKKRSKDKHSSPSAMIFINDLNDSDDDEGGLSRKPHRLKIGQRQKANLLGDAKSASLPPGLKGLSDSSHNADSNSSFPSHHHQHYHDHHHPSSRVTQESPKMLQTSSASDNVLKSNYSSLSSSAIAGGTNPAPITPKEHINVVASGAGTSAIGGSMQTAVVVASPNKTAADRFQRKYRRSRDEKPRRHTDGGIQFPSAIEQTNDWPEAQYLPYEDNGDEEGNNGDVSVHRHSHHHHRHHHKNASSSSLQQHPHLHDLNGAGHESTTNAKRFITRSQRATSAGIINGGTQPIDSSSSASNSPIPGHLSPSTLPIAATSAGSSLHHHHQEIPLLTESPTVIIGKTENGFAPKTNAAAANDMTNNSGSGGSVKPPTKSPSTAVVVDNNNASATTTTSTKLRSNACDLSREIPLKHQHHKPEVTAATDTSLDCNNFGAVTTEVAAASEKTVAKPPSVIADKKKGEENRQQQQLHTSPTSPKSPAQRPNSSCDNNQSSNKSPISSEGENTKAPMPSSSSSCSSPSGRSKKLIPSVSVSMKQNLNEMHCTASRANSMRSNANSPKSPKHSKITPSVECTVKVPPSPKSPRKQQSNGQQPSPTIATASSPIAPATVLVDDIDDDFMEIHDLPIDGSLLRPRCSTMHNDTRRSSSSSLAPSNDQPSLELSPVHRSRNNDRSPRRLEERDKSSKRKSNLNRSQTEEAIPDSDEAAARRRRRRELGMARTLLPTEDAAAAVKELIASPSKTRAISPPKPAIRNDLSYHLEMARRGLDQTSTANAMANRRRAQTASPKQIMKETPSTSTSSSGTNKPQNLAKVSRRSDTVALGELRKQRTDEVNRKMNERTRSDLAEIIKIAEIANEGSEKPESAIADLTNSMKRLRCSQEREESEVNPSSATAGKHATFHQEECIYYEPEPLEHIDENSGESKDRSRLGGILRSQRMLKARSIERESSLEPQRLSPILRRKSTDDPLNNTLSQTPNQIVSILKKKDYLSACESSSASSNASPVTFSASVMDTPSKQKRSGILKKRSSLDESRYYSRSHSPDERSIFIKSARRNSLEETAANGNNIGACSFTHGTHGILKQSSYDSFKSDSCPSTSGGAMGGGSGGESQHPHSILKKKDSTSTPSDCAQGTKHVSISQAVILAAAELSATEPMYSSVFNDDLSYTPGNEEYDIKPILKLETSINEDCVKPPKPILKKKSSGDSDEHEIKPILKTSRKSSREEFDFDPFSDGENAPLNQEPLVRPILKTDSPSKRRSIGGPEIAADIQNDERETNSPYMLKRRTRSLERQDQTPVIDLGAALNAIATSQENKDDLVASLTSSTPGANISVADRIKSMEKFLTHQSTGAATPSTSAVNTSWESPLQNVTNTETEEVAATPAMGAKILKPSVIRRDMMKDRYKTQPITSDEKNFFKSNDSSTLYTSPAGSAFKPAKSLEGLGFINITAHGNQSPNAAPSAFALTRSYTQPLHPTVPLTLGSFKPYPSVSNHTRKTPIRSSLQQLNDSITISDTTQSFTAGDSGLSCDSNSEQRIFEMSGIEQDVDMIENQEPKTPSNTGDASTTTTTGSSSGSGIVRTNSVRARANMFQQMQEKTNNGGGSVNREERTSPKRVPRRLSPSAAPLNANSNGDEPRTPNNPSANSDEEIEPTSLPVSERLRFFSSLSESRNRNSGSFTRSPPMTGIERSSSLSSYANYFMTNTPRSSTSQSSASVTPTPMECAHPWPSVLNESPTILKQNPSTNTGKITITTNAPSEDISKKNAGILDFTDSREVIKADIVKTSPFLQGSSKPITATPAHMSNNDTTPTSTLTPTMRRIKLKTIGKLMLPTTFLNNDRNNNQTSGQGQAKENGMNSSNGNANFSEQLSVESNDSVSQQPPKKIGKIKSPFIENCNQMQQNKVQINSKCIKFDYRQNSQPSTALASLENSSDHHASNNALSKYFNNSAPNLSNGHGHQSMQYHLEDSNTDSGKENIDTSSPALTDATSTITCKTTPVVEIRRKFTRKNTPNTQSLSVNGVGRTQITPRSASFNGSSQSSSPQIDSKYAKYFGLQTNTSTTMNSGSSASKSSKTPQIPPPLPKQPPPQMAIENSDEVNFSASILSPSAEAINQHVHLWRTPNGVNRGVKRMASGHQQEVLKKFEDIIVTESELRQAAKDFDRLLGKDTVLQPVTTVELEKIFSSIV